MSTENQPAAEHHFQHDPDKTELEKVLNVSLDKIEPYSSQLLVAFVAIALLFGGWIYMSRTSGQVSTVGWKEFASTTAPSDFKAIAEKHPNAPVATWALLQAARGYTSEGLQQALTNREASDESLGEARDAYKQLLDRGQKVPPEAREEALFGMATCLEALSGADTSEAVAAYETLLKEFPQTRHRRWADRRIAILKQPQTEAFYAWFRKQNPTPDDRPLPKDLMHGGGIDLPGFEIPTGTGSSKPAMSDAPGGSAAPFPEDAPDKTPASATPPAPALPAPSDSAAPAAEKEVKPAEEAKPAPTAEKPAPAEGEAAKPAEEAKPADAPATPEEKSEAKSEAE